MQPTPRARQLLAPLSEAISKLREAFETQAAFRPDASDREFLIATNDYVDSLLLPRVGQEWVHMGDVLRLAFCIVLLWAAVR